jgi:hypothetical protein
MKLKLVVHLDSKRDLIEKKSITIIFCIMHLGPGKLLFQNNS